MKLSIDKLRSIAFLIIDYFKKGAEQLNLSLLPSITPIQLLFVGDAGRVMNIQQQLLEKGILVGAIRAPTVPNNSERLRITLNALQTKPQLDRLLEALATHAN